MTLLRIAKELKERADKLSAGKPYVSFLIIKLTFTMKFYKGFRRMFTSQSLLLIFNMTASVLMSLFGVPLWWFNGIIAVVLSFSIHKYYLRFKFVKIELLSIINTLIETLDNLESIDITEIQTFEQ